MKISKKKLKDYLEALERTHKVAHNIDKKIEGTGVKPEFFLNQITLIGVA